MGILFLILILAWPVAGDSLSAYAKTGNRAHYTAALVEITPLFQAEQGIPPEVLVPHFPADGRLIVYTEPANPDLRPVFVWSVDNPRAFKEIPRVQMGNPYSWLSRSTPQGDIWYLFSAQGKYVQVETILAQGEDLTYLGLAYSQDFLLDPYSPDFTISHSTDWWGFPIRVPFYDELPTSLAGWFDRYYSLRFTWDPDQLRFQLEEQHWEANTPFGRLQTLLSQIHAWDWEEVESWFESRQWLKQNVPGWLIPLDLVLDREMQIGRVGQSQVKLGLWDPLGFFTQVIFELYGDAWHIKDIISTIESGDPQILWQRAQAAEGWEAYWLYRSLTLDQRGTYAEAAAWGSLYTLSLLQGPEGGYNQIIWEQLLQDYPRLRAPALYLKAQNTPAQRRDLLEQVYDLALPGQLIPPLWPGGDLPTQGEVGMAARMALAEMDWLEGRTHQAMEHWQRVARAQGDLAEQARLILHWVGQH